MKHDYMGGIFLEDNDYELKITLGAAYSNVTINVFVFKY